MRIIKTIINFFKFFKDPKGFFENEMKTKNQREYEKWVDSFTLSKEEVDKIKQSKEFNDKEYRNKMMTDYYKNKDYRGDV